MSAPMLFLRPRELERGNVAAPLGLLFPVMGLGLMVWAGISLARLLKCGESTLHLETAPVVVGGRLTGVVRTSKRVPSAKSFDATLSACTITGSGKSRHESIVWQKCSRATPAPGFGRTGTSIPVTFEIPPDASPTAVESRRRVVWRLELRSDIPGVDFYVQFEVPVLEGDVASQASRPASPPVNTSEIQSRLFNSGIRVEGLGKGKRFVFPPGRVPGAGWASLVTLLAWSGVVAVLFFSEVPRLFTWIGAAFDLLLLHGTLDLFFLASRIDVQKGELILRRGRFGREKARRFAADEIAKIEAIPGMQWRGRLLYNLRLVKPNGRDRTLARHLPDLETAELLARELEAVLL